MGGVAIRNRILLAPMSGVTDVPFRTLAWRFGAGLVVTEMIAGRELVKGNHESLRRVAGAGQNPHMVQIAGCEPRWMAEAARAAVDHGADLIDINMGCPAKKVTGGYSGSALMRDPDHALSLVEATVAASTVPVTLKMRLGWDEQSLNGAEIAKKAEAAGISMITVHGRTRCQFYEGSADWDAIARVRDAVRVPFVANGDVASSADVETILAKTGADAVMVGRAAQGRPWLPGALAGSKTPDPSSLFSIITEHYAAMLQHYGESAGVRHARKHLGWYLDRHGCDGKARREIMTAKEPAMVLSALQSVFSIPSSSSQALELAA